MTRPPFPTVAKASSSSCRLTAWTEVDITGCTEVENAMVAR